MRPGEAIKFKLLNEEGAKPKKETAGYRNEKAAAARALAESNWPERERIGFELSFLHVSVTKRPAIWLKGFGSP
jgi:hypothetical protein